jgi:hypothetical protein
MSRSLVDQLIAGLGTLGLGFGIGCRVTGRYIYAKSIAYSASAPPAWLGTVQALTWAGLLAFGLAALTLIIRDYRRRTTAESTTKPG